jgi:hypothetical protein
LTAGRVELRARRQEVERGNSHSALIVQGRTPLRAQRQNPPIIAAKYNDLDDRANQQATNGHGKAGESKAPAKDGHGVEIARVDKDNLEDDKSASAGTRKPEWLRALVAAALLDDRVSGTLHKKARGREVQFPFCLDCKRVYTAQRAKAKPPAITAKHNNLDDRTNQRPYGGYGKVGAPKAPAIGCAWRQDCKHQQG